MADALERLAAPAPPEADIANWLAAQDPDELDQAVMKRRVLGEPVMWTVLEVLKEWAGGDH